MKKILFSSLIVLLILILSLPRTVNAKSEIFSDDFSLDLNKWEPVRDSGQYWSLVNGQLKAEIINGFTVTELIPKEQFLSHQLNQYEYQLDIYPVLGVDRNVSFGFIDTNNWYEIHFFGNNQFEVVKYKNSVKVWSRFGSGNLQNNVFNKVIITYRFGSVNITINNNVIFNDSDPTYLNDKGVIGMKAGTGAAFPTKIYFDNVKVYSLDDSTPTPAVTLIPTTTPTPTVTPTPLPTATPQPSITPTPTPTASMPHFKQNDDAWGDHVYNSATKWSPKKDTIADWGCAITSLAMIMRYHNIDLMPDGTSVDPDSINTWLKNQKDGYIGKGLLNWAAAMRLVKEIHDKYDTTKLEYRKINNGSIASAITEIDKQQPVIANIPGHFLVADEAIENDTDLGIKDPFYDYTKISQHSDNPTSYRAFKPSQTDLSNLVMVTNPTVSLRVQDPHGQDISNQAVSTEYITAPATSENSTTSPQQVIEIAKPETGSYTITIASVKPQILPLEIYSYDQAGQVQAINNTTYVHQQPTTISITYSDDGSVLVNHQANWTSFRRLLRQPETKNGFTHPALLKIIDTAAASASASNKKHQLQIKHMLTILIENVPDRFISASIRNNLLTELAAIQI